MVVYIPPQPYDFDQVYRISCEFPPIEYISNSITTQLVSPISLSFFFYVMLWYGLSLCSLKCLLTENGWFIFS